MHSGAYDKQGDASWRAVVPEASRTFRLLHPGNLGYKHDLTPGILDSLSDVPSTTYENFRARVAALGAWKAKLRKGIFPEAGKEIWPAIPLQQELLGALSRLEMPRFCRRYPALLDALLRQILQVVIEFEAQVQAGDDQSEPEQPQYSPGGPGLGSQQAEDGSADQSPEKASGQPGDLQGLQPHGPQDPSDADDQSGGQVGGKGGGQQLEASIEEVMAGQEPQREEQEVQEAVAKAAEEVVENFEREWEPMMDSVEESLETFGSIEGLLEGGKGFDSSQSVWSDAGWREIKELRKMLENLKEITTLVKSLGRSSGKGPLKRAPQQVFAGRGALGMHRSPLQPEETVGLTRSGDISMMLPCEAQLLAASKAAAEDPDFEGWSALRRLHMARRAEKTLLSYERSGWMEDTTVVTKHSEIRPSAEMGPIICCLDTSGSMHGMRSTVAKAVTLECMRMAHRQKRQCFLYAFGGPGETEGIDLSLNKPGVMEQLLTFLRFSFGGGTDVDRPLELALSRLEKAEWKQADILMVTDGEIPAPSARLQNRLKAARDEMGLEVHGLLVGNHGSGVMRQFATHLHVFKAWDAVKASGQAR